MEPDQSRSPAYSEPHRPQFHFTPPENWMNDPNGLVYHEGEYHLFYQYNPYGEQWGHMSWGHAVSDDMLHWEHLPVALEEENGIMIFSGSAVVDRQNTSGLGTADNPPMVAVYTGHYTDEDNPRQDQRIAYSLDNGRSWTKYTANPVIDEAMENFRDPKVIWHTETERWIMVVALPTRHKVRFYSSPNLLDWKLESEFGPAGATGGVWECPDLFELPVDGREGESRWVLQVDLNPGSVAGGSGGQYFVGSFDGKTFSRDEHARERTNWVDYGKDFYAVQSFSNMPDNRRVWLAWMNNWQYAGVIPVKPWRGAMTVPRELGLAMTEQGPRLYQQPVPELQQIYKERHQMEDIQLTAGEDVRHDQLRGTAFRMKMTVRMEDAKQFGVRVRKGESEETVIGYDVAQEQLFVDRKKSGEVKVHESFADTVQAAPLETDNQYITLDILVDHSSVEVFANEGRRLITNRIFPRAASDRIELFSRGGTVHIDTLTFWPLKSVWNTAQQQ
ncbi:glycoside hydrolase family 32 protein [Fodinibius sediminis]|nr:glycoside hydrolase family 32 protein [Fodinibius sediminis]